MTPTAESSADRTASLLNLLKFNQNSQATAPAQLSAADRRPSQNIFQGVQQGDVAAPGRAISASDLVASFTRKAPSSTALQPPPIASPAPSRSEIRVASSSAGNPQDFLLRLLNQAKPPQTDSAALSNPDKPIQSIETGAPEAVVDDLAQDLADADLEEVDSNPRSNPDRASSPMRVFGSEEPSQAATFEPLPTSANNSSIFTYVNPFEQLSASSPRNRTPKPEVRSGTVTPKLEVLKHGRDTGRDVLPSGPAAKSRRLSPSATQSPERTNLASAAAPQHRETVSEALSEVGEQVEKQLEEVLKAAEANTNGHADTKQDLVDEDFKELEQAIHEAAVEIKAELKDEDTRRALEQDMPKPIAEAFEAVIDSFAQDPAADSWESADAEDSPAKEDESIVRVYNFPMKPFVSIDIKKLQEPPTPIRQDIITDIARLKKEFDQIDRTLVTASQNFILYALSKHGGFRLIRQDSGQYKQVFHNSQERIFNLAVCTGASISQMKDCESVIATGINGSVFWTVVHTPQADVFGEDHLEDRGFIFPPIPAHDDNTSGGQLKTRAKKSSRHPEYFAVGRGKSIHIVWPSIARLPKYTNPKTRICDSEKYLKERSLKIATGKAGKDFTFSEDDTIIVSLDKAGKMRFWDVRDLVNPAFDSESTVTPLEVDKPLLTLSTTSPTDKTWPTSVMFLDKDRPCAKGIALRYMLVGMKQNHTLQLWDLGLGKPVQEINFPHDNETDAICSLAYHPKSGVLAVGHPTRNSIYFIHLSAPKYNLPPMSQARYITRLVQNDRSLPTPESTAIMSGIREYSFASKGRLRSLDMLSSPSASAVSEGMDPQEDAIIFELYVMHSKGCTRLDIRREDLGWSPDNKVVHPVDAEASGAVAVNNIRSVPPAVSEPPTNDESPPSKSGSSAPVKTAPREAGKKETATISRTPQVQAPEAAVAASTPARVEDKQDAGRATAINGTDKTEKKKKKRTGAGDAVSQISNAATSGNPALVTPASYALAARRAKSPSPSPQRAPVADTVSALQTSKPETVEQVSIDAGLTAKESSVIPSTATVPAGQNDKDAVSGVLASFTEVLRQELDTLYGRLDEERRVQDASGYTKQESILRLVSSTLRDNVEKELSRIISSNMQSIVLPHLGETIASVVNKRLGEILSQQLQFAVPQQVKESLPGAMTRALQEPETLRTISELVSNTVATQLEAQISTSLRSNVTPLLVNAAQQMAGDLDRRVMEQFRLTDVQRQGDAVKIDQLTHLVRGLSETVTAMAAAQSDFQGEVLKLQRQVSQISHTREASGKSVGSASQTPATPVVAKSPEDEELDAITQRMTEGDYQEGTIMVSDRKPSSVLPDIDLI